MDNDRAPHVDQDAAACEYGRGDRIGTAYLDGFTFLSEPVQYVVIDGRAIFEGDIDLGPVEQVEQSFEMIRADLTGTPYTKAIVVTPGSQRGWPNWTIPYQIDPDLPDEMRVTNAIGHWIENTKFTFVRRRPENAEDYPDYVEFVPGDTCSSAVGRQGGRQRVRLTDTCQWGNVAHEIGHAAGLWHEQSRADRDAYVTIQWENIESGEEGNFSQHITDGDDIGGYDYGSIMHYGRYAWSTNGEPTIVPTDPSAQIGQRNGLSAGDLRAINTILCPTVPNVREDRLRIAVPKIRAVGLVPDINGSESGEAWVWRQSPLGGQPTDRGSVVGLRTRTTPIE